MTVHQLSRTDARRIAVRAQLLAKPRPTDMHDVIRHLTLVQLEPTAAVAPSADLVLWSRLGSAYERADLQDALEDQSVIDHRGLARPSEDMALYRAEMAAWPGVGPLKAWQEDNADWVRANDGCRREILDLLRQDGPLPASELPDTCEVPWRSSGWNDDRNVRMLLGFLVQRGEVATAGRDGRDKLWDLASRIYPDDPVPDVEEARRLRDDKRLRALGIARAKAPAQPAEPLGVGEAGEAAVIERVKGEWRVDPSQLGQSFAGRAALLSPLDLTVSDRKRTTEIFEYEYLLEMYKPAAHRRWGYYALPILYGDRLVGKLDATADRKDGVLRAHAVHEDAPFRKAITAAVDGEIADLARWLGLELERET